MQLSIQKATQLSNQILKNIGFKQEEAELITRNLIDAELAEKKSHGLSRLLAIARRAEAGEINVNQEDIEIVKDELNALFLNAHQKPGIIPLYKSLDLAIPKAKTANLVAVGIKNAEYASGYIGSYALQAAKENLIFIGFNNSPGAWAVPHGAKVGLWGTNPLTVGVPSSRAPVILDMATTKRTVGDIIHARNQGKQIEENVALDEASNPTTDPAAIMKGWLLPIAGHKGSGLAYIVHLLAGVLTGTKTKEGGWGSSYILINPAMFRPIDEFKKDVDTAIQELKSAPKAEGVEEIFYPGEQSQRKMKENKKKDRIEVNKDLHQKLTALLE